MNKKEDLLLNDKHILIDEGLISLQEECQKRHGESDPTYLLCRECVKKLVGILAELHLASIFNINSEQALETITSIFYPPPTWPQSGDKAHAYDLALRDAGKHEDVDLPVNTGWIVYRARHYMRANKQEKINDRSLICGS